MAESISTGFVTKIQNYEDHDQIVTILTLDGFLTFLAKGVRKITSKNRRSLQLGNLIEIEFFQARLSNKLSKLKRAHLVKQVDVVSSNNASIISDVLFKINQIKQPHGDIFIAFNQVYSHFGLEYNHQIITYMTYNMLSSFGVKPHNHGCADCQRYDEIDGFDFGKGGFTCTKHSLAKKPLALLKAIVSLQASFESYKTTSASLDKLIYEEMMDFVESRAGVFRFR